MYWGIVFLSSEADPRTSFSRELNLARKEEGGIITFCALLTLAGALIWIFYALFDSGCSNELKNIYRYLFKSEPPTIKFQSPIVIQKAVDPESDVG